MTPRKHVMAGKIALPGFLQRPQVWNDQETCKELVISLCQVLIGSYLLWEYDLQVQKDTEVVEFPHVDIDKQNVDYLLVDGQQRMTTISQFTTSEFGKSYKVEFRKVSATLTRPVVHKIKAIPKKKPYAPDLSTINKQREIRLCDLAGNAKISSLDSDAKQQADVFRQSLKAHATYLFMYLAKMMIDNGLFMCIKLVTLLVNHWRTPIMQKQH